MAHNELVHEEQLVCEGVLLAERLLHLEPQLDLVYLVRRRILGEDDHFDMRFTEVAKCYGSGVRVDQHSRGRDDSVVPLWLLREVHSETLKPLGCPQ